LYRLFVAVFIRKSYKLSNFLDSPVLSGLFLIPGDDRLFLAGSLKRSSALPDSAFFSLKQKLFQVMVFKSL
jgi:hypothetical protein